MPSGEPYHPLFWPDQIRRPSGLDRFLADLPYFGLYARKRHEVVSQLEARDPALLDESWKDHPSPSDQRNEIARLVQFHLGWPNTLYSPHDPCEILFWDPDLATVELLCALDEKYGFREDPMPLLFGDLVRQLQQ